MLRLVLVTRETLPIYAASILVSQFAAAGVGLSMVNIPYINIPEKNQTNFIGFFSTTNTLAALIGIFAGREFIMHTEDFKTALFGIDIGNKHVLMLITAAFLLLSSLVIRFIIRYFVLGPSKGDGYMIQLRAISQDSGALLTWTADDTGFTEYTKLPPAVFTCSD